MAKFKLKTLVERIVVEEKNKSTKLTYPADHEPVARVPLGGSMCLNCRWVSEDLEHCGNEHFQKYTGSDVLPYPADEMCSDWWEPAEGALDESDIEDDEDSDKAYVGPDGHIRAKGPAALSSL